MRRRGRGEWERKIDRKGVNNEGRGEIEENGLVEMGKKDR
jgi:hypothetical protein